MTGNWMVGRSLERVRALAQAPLDSHGYRAAVRHELRAAVAHDAWVWPLTDPGSGVGIAPMAQVPCPAELPLLITLKYRTRINRWTGLPTAPAQAASLREATVGELDRSELWAGLLRRYGIVDVLSVAFADRLGLWGWLDLWRGPGQPAFSAEELRHVSSLAGVVTAGLRACSAREFQLDAMPRSGGQGKGHQQAVLVLADDLSIVSQTESARPWLDLLQRGPRPHQGIPAEVLNVAAQLLATETGVDAHPATSRVHVGHGVWARLEAARMKAPLEGGAAPIAVTIQDCLPAERLDVFERSLALSPRECQLLEYSAAGLDTATLARRLSISRYTVQDEFKSIFGKCNVQSRGALLAMALGPLTAAGD